jgi:hypothetical protein
VSFTDGNEGWYFDFAALKYIFTAWGEWATYQCSGVGRYHAGDDGHLLPPVAWAWNGIEQPT